MKAMMVELRIADLQQFKEFTKRLQKISEADGWESADDIRQQVREALEQFASAEPS